MAGLGQNNSEAGGLKKGHARGRGIGETQGAEGTGEAGGKREEKRAEEPPRPQGPSRSRSGRKDMGQKKQKEGAGEGWKSGRAEDGQQERLGGRRDGGRRATGRRDKRGPNGQDGGRKGSNSEGAGRDR